MTLMWCPASVLVDWKAHVFSQQLPDSKLGMGYQTVLAHYLANSVALTLELFHSRDVLLSCCPVKMSP
jgi:hypothetical protein